MLRLQSLGAAQAKTQFIKMRVLELKLGKNRRDINPGELENLFADGLNQIQIARRLKMDKSFLSGKINQSVELMQARTRGQRKAA